MREYTYEFKNTFSGLTPMVNDNLSSDHVSICHNLVPQETKNYDIHELIIDMNADGVSWGGYGKFVMDTWIDDDGDAWTDDNGDLFIDD